MIPLTPTEAAVEFAIAAVPSLLKKLEDHRTEYEELLPTVFFGEVAHWAAKEVGNGSSDAAKAFSTMELLLTAGALDVQDLVVTGFLEALAFATNVDESFVHLGPDLRRAYEKLISED